MIEIICRPKNKEQEKTQLNSVHSQVSYNSDGHLVVRLINGKNESLIVFDTQTSKELIKFCQCSLASEILRTL